MSPDVREHFEIRFAITLVTFVVPEADRHRGERRGEDQFADFIDHLDDIAGKRMHVHAQQAGMDVAGWTRQCRSSAYNAAAQLSAARMLGSPQNLRPAAAQPSA